VNLLEGFRVAASPGLSDAEMTYFPDLLLRDRAQEVIALLDAKSAKPRDSICRWMKVRGQVRGYPGDH
jgi:hypothetical protein